MSEAYRRSSSMGRSARSPTRPSAQSDARYAPVMAKGPTREWVMFDDPREDGRIWQIDVTFMLSSWDCIFGTGCQGVHTERAPETARGHGSKQILVLARHGFRLF